VCGETHAYVGEVLFSEAGEKPEEEQAHAMEHQTAGIFFHTSKSPFVCEIV
jgi:hypothetical protein